MDHKPENLIFCKIFEAKPMGWQSLVIELCVSQKGQMHWKGQTSWVSPLPSTALKETLILKKI